MNREAFVLVRLLKEYDLKVSCAESCTGGLIVSDIVSVPGASEVLNSSFVTYSAGEKERLLKVPKDLIQTYGVVSHETARAMAFGLEKAAPCDLAIVSTGVAGPGPDGDIPAGTVFLGAALKTFCVVRKFYFPGTRALVRHKAANEALALAVDLLSGDYRI